MNTLTYMYSQGRVARVCSIPERIHMKRVLLVHGIFMNPAVMTLLSKRLEKNGYETATFGYPFHPNEEDLSTKLQTKVSEWKPDVAIGHSLGGNILVRQLLKLDRCLQSIICLGSPLNGSSVAKRVQSSPFSPLVSPAAQELLVGDLSIPETDIKVGLIAGTSSYIGFNLIFRTLEGESDGTVGLHETKVKNLTDWVTVDVGHTALVTSEKVIPHIVSFIEQQRFVRI